MFIYLIVNRETGKYYIGQHKGNNLKKYLQQKFHHAQRGISENSRLFRSMRAHPDPSIWSIHALRSDIQTREELDQIERDFIKFLKAQDPGYGYNICRGGEGFTGPHTEETKKKLSASIREGMSTTAYRQKRSRLSREMWQRPGYREDHITKMKETLSSPDKRAEKARISKELWLNNQERRAKQSQFDRIAWSDPEKRAKRIDAIKKGHANPTTRAKCSEASRQRWLDPACRVRMTQSRKSRRIDLAGRSFGLWKVLHFAGTMGKESMWWAECQGGCRIQKAVAGSSLRGGTSRSCGYAWLHP